MYRARASPTRTSRDNSINNNPSGASEGKRLFVRHRAPEAARAAGLSMGLWNRLAHMGKTSSGSTRG